MGLKDILVRREQAQVAKEDKPFDTLFIADGDAAVIRFVDDDMYEERKFHTKVKEFSSGKKFTFTIPCVDKCAYCKSVDTEVAKQKTKIMAWVYVSEILHTTSDKEGKWVAKKRAGGKTVYVETVDAIRLFLNSVGNKGALSEQIIELYSNNGTITDRFFSWGRKGSKQLDTTYSLVPRDKSDFEIAIKTPMTLSEAADYMLRSANSSLNFNGNNSGSKSVSQKEEVPQEVSEATQKALDDIITGAADDDEGSLF